MKFLSSIVATLGAVAFAPVARADDQSTETMPSSVSTSGDADYYEVVSPDPYSYEWREPRMQSQIGVGVIVGGGITGFTDQLMRDTISNNVGGLWNARVSIGTHIPIGLDLSYVGSAAQLRTLDNRDNGTLVGTSLEAAVRFNVMPHYTVNPYVFAGLGWQRYDVNDPNFGQAATGLRGEDNLLIVPMGVGVSYRDLSGLIVDVRGTFRAAQDSGLLSLPEGTDGNAELHTWEASAAIGYEF